MRGAHHGARRPTLLAEEKEVSVVLGTPAVEEEFIFATDGLAKFFGLFELGAAIKARATLPNVLTQR